MYTKNKQIISQITTLPYRKKEENDEQAVSDQSVLSDDMIYEMRTAVVNDLQLCAHVTKKQLDNVQLRQ